MTKSLHNTFVDYIDNPRIHLAAVQTMGCTHQVSDLYSKPDNQFSEHYFCIETIKKQESELINNKDYGLLSNVAKSQIIKTRTGAPTPDDLDELLTKVWKEPGFFLLHPLAIAAFGRECTRRGVPPPTTSLFGSQFLTWRGIPLIPSDKLPIVNGKSKIILLRTGESRQGIGLINRDKGSKPRRSVRLWDNEKELPLICTLYGYMHFSRDAIASCSCE